MTTATFKPATDKQVALVHKLSDEKVVPVAGKDEDEAWLIARWEDIFSGKDVSTKEASRVIDWMFTLPRKPAVKSAAAQLETGIYLAPNGDVIKVQAARESGHLYAKVAVVKGTTERLNLLGEVVKFQFVYAPGLIKHITPQMKMTEEQALEFTLKFKQCMACGRKLEAAKSVKAGIGPVCIKYFQ